MCGMSKPCQDASVRSAPKSAGGHKNPEMTPVGSKANTGAKTK